MSFTENLFAIFYFIGSLVLELYFFSKYAALVVFWISSGRSQTVNHQREANGARYESQTIYWGNDSWILFSCRYICNSSNDLKNSSFVVFWRGTCNHNTLFFSIQISSLLWDDVC